MMTTKYRNPIQYCRYISQRITMITMRGNGKTINKVGIYAPKENESDQKKEAFYDNLQTTSPLLKIREDISPNVGIDHYLELCKNRFDGNTTLTSWDISGTQPINGRVRGGNSQVVNKPNVVVNYSKFMVGVDRADSYSASS